MSRKGLIYMRIFQAIVYGMFLALFAFSVFSGIKVAQHHWVFIIHSGVTLFVLYQAFSRMWMKIPNDPPYVGVLVILGRKYPVLIAEGWHLFIPWSDIFTAVLVKVTPENLDLEFTIRAKSTLGQNRVGARLKVKAHVTYIPDKTSGEKLMRYISAGRERVKTIISDIISAEIRQQGAGKSSEEYSFSREELVGVILSELKSSSVLSKMGIEIFNFVLGEMEIVGKAGESSEKLEEEEFQRRGEREEQRFVQAEARNYIEMGLTPAEAVEAVQVERGKSEKKITAFRGFEFLKEVAEKVLGK